MPTIFTSGPSKITITELGGPRVPFGLLAVIGGAAWAAHRYGHTIGQDITIIAVTLFVVLLSTVIAVSVLLALRIRRELRALRTAPARTTIPAIQRNPAPGIPVPAPRAIPSPVIIRAGQATPVPVPAMITAPGQKGQA